MILKKCIFTINLKRTHETIPIAAICISLLYRQFQLFAKKSYLPGYYITNSNDSIKGYIYADKKNEFDSISFKADETEKNSQKIPVDSCLSFLSRDDQYFMKMVTRNMTYIDKFSYEITWQDSSITEAIPLRLLYYGPILSLYSYKDVKDHFFMYDGEKMQELIVRYRYVTEADKLRLKLYNAPRFFIDKDYFRQIGAALNYHITERQWYLIQMTEYEEKPMIKLFKNLNGAKRK